MKESIYARLWNRIPVVIRAIVIGLVVAMVAVNVWLLLLLNLGAIAATIVEVIFLAGYLWWMAGNGPPAGLRAVRAQSFRKTRLSGFQWTWGLIAAVFFAVTVHSAIVLLFRIEPFPAAAFHAGYDLSFIPSTPLRWLAVVISALSAGVCEETGFRGYMQRPIEKRHGAVAAIFISSLFFMLLHLTKDWALVGMVPIVFGAGVLLGTLAWASQSLIPCIIGHTIMDIGLFGYWWTNVAGTFAQRPISETGLDSSFAITCIVFVVALAVTLVAIVKLRRATRHPEPASGTPAIA